MKRAMELVLAVLAVGLAGAFLAGAIGGGAAGDASRADRHFHAGKTPPQAREGGCRSGECHGVAPHARELTLAAFRNMHVGFVDCMACHGRNARGSWSAKPPAQAPKRAAGAGTTARERWRLAGPAAGGEGKAMHERLGAALACRACHSEEGARDIAAAGIRELPAGFANPLAAKMIEEGARQWIPDTMR